MIYAICLGNRPVHWPVSPGVGWGQYTKAGAYVEVRSIGLPGFLDCCRARGLDNAADMQFQPLNFPWAAVVGIFCLSIAAETRAAASFE